MHDVSAGAACVIGGTGGLGKAVCRCLGGAFWSSARIWSMTACNGPRTGAFRFLVWGIGLGSDCRRILRMVFRECPNTLAICLMGILSRYALRMAP